MVTQKLNWEVFLVSRISITDLNFILTQRSKGVSMIMLTKLRSQGLSLSKGGVLSIIAKK